MATPSLTPTITGTVGPLPSAPPPGVETGDPLPMVEGRRQQLDSIITRMMANKESDENISAVVRDFKQKYSAGPPPAAPLSLPPDDALSRFTPEEAPSPLGFAKNVITSTGNQIGNVAHAAAHPIETVGNISKVLAGAANEYIPGNAALAQKLGDTPADTANDNRMFDAFKQNLADRYGSLDQFGHTFYKDPAGVLMDLSMLFGGVEGAARGVGAVADVADAANVASRATQVADAAGRVAHGINPLTITGQAAGAIAEPLAGTRAGGAVVNALTPVAAKASAVAGKAVDAFDRLNDQSVGETVRSAGDAAVNKLKITPQLDPAEASAVRYGDEQGVQMPTSVRTGSKVAQNAENILQNLPFSSGVAKAARANEQATLARAGANEVEQLGGTPPGHTPGSVPTPLDAGEAIHAQLDKNIAEHHAAAGESYDLLRSIESQPQFKANVQTGTRRVEAGIDEVGNPTYKNVPVMEDVQLPVPLRPVKLALKPIYDRMMRQMPVAQQQASAGLKALSNIVNGPDFESASITDENLGAIKKIARDTNSPVGQGLAKMAVKELDAAVRATVARAGPDATAALEQGRASTIAKYAAQDVKDALPAEPAQLAAKLTAPGDRNVNLLRSVAEHTPEHIPALAQSVAQGLIEKGTRDAGMDAPKGALSAWLKIGPETKSILFKGREQGITDWLTLNKKMAENPNPSGSGSLLMMGKAGLMTLHNPVTGIATLLGGKALAKVLFTPTGARNLIASMKLPMNSGKIGATVAADILKAAGAEAQPVRTTPNGPSTMAANGATIAGDGSGTTTAGAAGGRGALSGEPGSGAAAGAGAVGGKRSRFTTVEIPGRPGRGYKAEYVISELGDSQASHSGLTFQPNPQATLKNPRDYSKQVNQRKVLDNSSVEQFNPAFHTTLAPDALNGPPVEDAAKQVLTGHGRHMTQEIVYANNPKGAQALRDSIAGEAAGIEGLNPQDAYTMKRPSLRRRISDEEFARHGPNARERLIADSNVPGTAALTPGERAISDARRVSTGTLDDMAARLDAQGPKATVADILEGQPGREVLAKLIDDGVIAPQEQAALTTKDGLTKAGRDRISQLMIGRYFSDPAQMDSIPLSVRAKVERIAAPLAQVEAKGEWNLTPDMQTAIGLVDDAKRAGAASIDDYIRQQGFFGKDQYSPNAITLAKAMKTAKSTELTAAARQYAQDAAYAAKGTQTLMGDAPTPEQSFAESFGALKSGAQSEAEKFAPKKNVRSEETRFPYDAPTLGGNRNESYPANSSDLDHLQAARFTRAPLAEADAKNAIAHVANLSGFEYMNRMTTHAIDEALSDELHGKHFSPDTLDGVISNLKSDEANLQGIPAPALDQLMQAAQEAKASGKSLVFVKDHQAIPDARRATALTEEVNHAAQYAGTGDLRTHLRGSAAAFTRQGSLGSAAQQALENNNGYQFNSPHEAAVEIGVRLMEPGRYQELGLSKAQAHALAFEYMQRLEKEYGRAAVSRITSRIKDAFR